MDMSHVLGLILGGGKGSRLYPLTRDRAKPAVPLAGKYRLIDIPMSGCIHAGIEKIAILTQFNSVSLHRHIYGTYSRDVFSGGWVQILAAEQTYQGSDWYQGTADAVRKQLVEIKSADTELVLILAGDHLYRMDYKEFVRHHIETGADITVAVQPVEADGATALGILKLDDESRIVSFTEKPTKEKLKGLESGNNPDRPYMGSMGIYIFSTDMLLKMLEEESGDDFGGDIIPAAIGKHKVSGFVFDGYWEDIGTMKRFYDVNLQMAAPDAPFDFYSPKHPIYTHPRFLPASEIYGADLTNVLLPDGCRIGDAIISDSVIGLRSVIGEHTTIRKVVMMGSDVYETDDDREENGRLQRPHIGIGTDCSIKRAIIDKNARIGDNVAIRSLPDREDGDHESWFSRDGIVIIPKNAIIPDGTVI